MGTFSFDDRRLRVSTDGQSVDAQVKTLRAAGVHCFAEHDFEAARMNDMELCRICDARNMRRYYRLDIERDLSARIRGLTVRRLKTFRSGAMDTTSIILTSTVIATFLSSAINAVVGHYAKQRDFKNDYYKTIIQRRIQAYEQVEALVVKLKTSILDKDDKLYHFLFSDEEGKLDNYLNSYADIHPHQLWMSETLFEKLRELQEIMFVYKQDTSIVEFGKQNYRRVADLRHSIEVTIATDMLSLYDVEGFLKRKQSSNSTYRALPFKAE